MQRLRCPPDPHGPGPTTGWALPEAWQPVLGERALRPVQSRALPLVLEGRRNLVVCAPTNSGKSLVGHLALLDAVRQGRRALLLEPLRALAASQAVALRGAVSRSPCPRARVRLSTGDYRLKGELLMDPPPKQGEIVVATPERLDAILRRPEHDPWVHSLGAVVVDEAQLIADPRRGPGLEHSLAALRASPAPPRVVLLSATLGEPEHLAEWLAPCDLVRSQARVPPLELEVLALRHDDDADGALAEEVAAALEEPGTAALVFVYRRADAVALARRLRTHLGELAGPDGVRACHAGLTRHQRDQVAAALDEGRCRCAVTTSALAMGLNLPATHVWVRDTTYHGVGPVRVGALLQMLGRAGRGERPGRGAVLVRPSDAWDPLDLVDALAQRRVEPVRSSLVAHAEPERVGEVVARLLARAPEGRLTRRDLQGRARATLAGDALADRVVAGLAWLESPSRALAARAGDHWQLTALGRLAVASTLPLAAAAGFALLLRDLVSLPGGGALLQGWTPMDSLVVAELLSDRRPRLGPWTRERERRAADHLASAGAALAPWLRDGPEDVLGSLGLPQRGDEARNLATRAWFRAAILAERQHQQASWVAAEWGTSALMGEDEAWRDQTIWRLSGMASICQGRAFAPDGAGAVRRVRDRTWQAAEALTAAPEDHQSAGRGRL